MTSRALCATVLIALLGLIGCRGRHSRSEIKNEEPAAASGLSSSLKMSDQSAAAQLTRGFYALESGSWRWTAGSFQAALRPPMTSSEKGAVLLFSFSIPDVLIQKLSAVNLSASIGSTKLKSEKYAKAGSYTFSADVPASLLTGEKVTVDFALDKSLAAGTVDQRELGLVATAIGLESK
ncbi:MAG: hypothetical protein JWN34_3899 [Bryobacterales bacterium]|nr:hypothetical protein [Bryobacterales bacterium]